MIEINSLLFEPQALCVQGPLPQAIYARIGSYGYTAEGARHDRAYAFDAKG